MFTFEWYVWFLEKTWFFIAVILHAGLFPELQNPIVFKPCQSFSPREKESDRADEGFGMQGCEPLTHRLRRSPLSQSKRGIFFGNRFCDFAFRLRAKWQGGVFSYDSEVYKKGAVDSAVSYDIILIFYGEDLYTSSVRYIWRWVLIKSKETLCI